MKPALQQQIESILGARIQHITAVSGGDISNAYALECGKSRFFCKLNSSPQAVAMFLAEKDGLNAIARNAAIKTPEVIAAGELDGQSFLLLHFIESKRPDATDMAIFGSQLAVFHQTKPARFGWHQDNYIGSLPQSNREHTDWPGFYTRERLLPQLRLAYNRQFLEKRDIPTENNIESEMRNHSAEVLPCLLHGDLWAGNFIVSAAGEAHLIDPAVYIGHHEVDLAMSRLFGGFSAHFYDAYEQVIPPAPGAETRQDLYQLYFLLVHLNLFGKSYQSSVRHILSRYFL